MIDHLNAYCTKLISIYFLFFIVGCSANDSPSERDFESKEVKEVSLLLSADSSEAIVSPSWIKSDSGAFFFSDRNQVSRFDIDGQHLLSFGQEGRGPGEFQSPGDVWKFGDRYLIYDNNSKKFISYDADGNHIEDVTVDFIDFSGMPNVEALSPQQFVVSSGGKNGSLLALVDMASESTEYIGESVDKNVDSQRFQSPDERRQAISSGHIPAMYKNRVLLSSNKTGIYSFQQTTAILEKYDNSGKLIWQKDIKVPAIDGLFEKLFEENRARMKNEEMLLPFEYADGIAANEKGVAVKLNLFEGEPVTIVWVPNDGGDLTIVTFPELKKISPVPLRFAIADDGSHILFTDILEGKIYKADWPL